jgi:hypothetical protein
MQAEPECIQLHLLHREVLREKIQGDVPEHLPRPP